MLDTGKFKIVPSSKAGLMNGESLLVVRDQTSYLRVLGDEPRWELMTATASEDDGRYQVCGDKPGLIRSAVQLCQALGVSAYDTKDWIGRDYVKICVIRREREGEDLQGLLVEIVEKFFELYDGREVAGAEQSSEMRDLYEAIAPGDDGEDIYLVDGLWLGLDGSLHERGR